MREENIERAGKRRGEIRRTRKGKEKEGKNSVGDGIERRSRKRLKGRKRRREWMKR